MDYCIISFEANEVIGYIMKKLSSQGLNAENVSVVTKNEGMERAFDATKASCVVIVGGGNGARKMLAQRIGTELAENDTAKVHYENMLRRNSAYALSSRNVEKLISFPEGCEIFAPQFGIECGAVSCKGKKLCALLPSAPEDAIPMFERFVYPIVVKNRGYELKEFRFKAYGADDAEIKRKLAELPKSKGYTVSSSVDYRKDALLSLIFAKKIEDDEVREVLSRFCTLFADAIYADSDVSIEQRAVDLLKVRKKKVSIAESLTGGLICSKIVNVAGSSEIFDEGFVTYADLSKNKQLGVSQATLKKYGAVSDETAYEMAVGLLNKGCDVAMATTGIAGPGGGSVEKPVGLCFTAVGERSGIHIYRNVFQGDRNRVREQVACDALFKLIKLFN